MIKITKDDENIYLDDWVIPIGKNKEDVAARERIIWEMYGQWVVTNPDKKCYNENLKEDISVTFSSISETAQKAARNYQSTMAFWKLDFILKYAYKISEDKTHSKRQSKEYNKMLIMNVDIDLFIPYFSNIKLMVGVKKNGRKNMYCVTAIL